MIAKDQELLKQYQDEGSEAAFEELVRRHVNLVYACALRRMSGNVQNAQDVAQVVFVDLARRGGSIPDGMPLGAYLHRAACFAAGKLLRSERRRRERETEALGLQNLMEPDRDVDWGRVAPLLDESLNRLRPADRAALVLRFFEERSLAGVGVALGVSEESARKRVARALEKLRLLLARRGAVTTALALSTAFAAHASPTAPPELAATIATASISKAAAGTGAGFNLLKLLMAGKSQLATVIGIASIGISAPPLLGSHPQIPHRVSTARNFPVENPPAASDAEAAALLRKSDEALRRGNFRYDITDNIRLSTRAVFKRFLPDGKVERAEVVSGEPLRVHVSNRQGEWVLTESEAVKLEFTPEKKEFSQKTIALLDRYPGSVWVRFGPNETNGGVACRTVLARLSENLVARLAEDLRQDLDKSGRLKHDPDMDLRQFIARDRVCAIQIGDSFPCHYQEWDANGDLLTDSIAGRKTLDRDAGEAFEAPGDLPVFIASSQARLHQHEKGRRTAGNKGRWARLWKDLVSQAGASGK